MPYFKTSDGTRLAYDDYGVGRPVLFLHGWAGERKSNFGAYVPIMFEHGYRGINIDQRGSGETDLSNTRPVTTDLLAKDLREFIVSLDLRDLTLVGSSMGSNLILEYIRTYGCKDYLRSIVLVDQSPCITKKPGWDLGMYRGNYTLEEGLESYKVMQKGWMEYFVPFTKAVFPELEEKPEEEVIAFVEELNKKFHPDEIIDLFYSTQFWDVRDAVPQVTVPCAYFYADPGALYKPELVDYYREHVSGPYVGVGFKTTSHAFFWEMVDEFSSELFKFLEAY